MYLATETSTIPGDRIDSLHNVFKKVRIIKGLERKGGSGKGRMGSEGNKKKGENVTILLKIGD